MVPKSGVGGKAKNEAWKGVWVLRGSQEWGWEWFLRVGWEGAPTTLLGTILSFPKPFPPHSCEPWSTQPPFHASFLAFPDPSQTLSCFVKYAWWNIVSLKENMRCQVCLVKSRFPKTSWKRTCFVVFVKYAWWSAVLQKQAKREHALSSIPDGMPVCKNMLKENMLCQVGLVKGLFAR